MTGKARGAPKLDVPITFALNIKEIMMKWIREGSRRIKAVTRRKEIRRIETQGGETREDDEDETKEDNEGKGDDYDSGDLNDDFGLTQDSAYDDEEADVSADVDVEDSQDEGKLDDCV